MTKALEIARFFIELGTAQAEKETCIITIRETEQIL